jgi:hypothetical protein
VDEYVSIIMGGQSIIIRCDAVPGKMTLPTARELVGQPFLQDYMVDPLLNTDRVGPIHFIACQGNVTESQATKMLGYPHATIVSTSFGVYVADQIQKIQIVLIANCQDQATTRIGVQKVFEWLKKSGEDSLLVKRAVARAAIVKAIASGMTGSTI